MKADVVIMETTYGKPQYVMPPTAEVLSAIVRFCRETLEHGDVPVLFGYSLGKSQEILRRLAEAALPVMLHTQTLRLTRVYEELGMNFPAYAPFSEEKCAGHVVICPPQSAHSAFVRKIKERRTAAITGWALDPGARFRYQCDEVFPLSDHADFNDLLRFVELTQPKRVLTLHGFAAEFAQTLRDRGIEAWALGTDNQLEMSLSAPPTKSPSETHVGPDLGQAEATSHHVTTPGQPLTSNRLDQGRALRETGLEVAPPATGPGDFSRLADVAENIRLRSGKIEKVGLLADYLAALPAEEARIAALFATGRPFSQAEGRTLQLGWSIIKRAVLDLTGLNEGDFKKAYLRYGDSGEATEALLAGHTQPQRFSLTQVAQFFHEVAEARGPTAKIALLSSRLRGLSPRAAKYLIKIITGDLRIGLKEGLIEEAIARATQRPIEEVRHAHMICGDLSEVVTRAAENTLGEIAPRVFRPLQFMLASPEPTAEAIVERLGSPVWLEEKYDGIRCQLHKQGERVELYSRDLHRISAQFPELVQQCREQLAGDWILDGELLAWRDGRALPFAELQKRLGRDQADDFFLGTQIPVSFSAYDCLWHQGEPLIGAPLQERRKILETLPTSRHVHLAPVIFARSALEIEAAFLNARARGNEGLMAKDPNSTYSPGRRGLAWLKLKKAYATLDVVVIGAEPGHGKRKGLLSDYTFAVREDQTGELLAVGKAYSGLTDGEIAQLTEHFLATTLAERGSYRTVAPDTILEIAFDSIQPSKRHASGFALRFPRILRIRTDKTVNDIDTLATCRRLAAGAF